MITLTDEQRARVREIAFNFWSTSGKTSSADIERAILQALSEIGAQMVEQEREACAKICTGLMCEHTIRARSKTT